MGFNTHDLGDLVTVSGVFTTPSTDAALDPSVVKLTIRTPAGVATTYTYGVGAVIVKDSTGHYYADIDANESGKWTYRWWSTGTGQAAEEQQFDVKAAIAV